MKRYLIIAPILCLFLLNAIFTGIVTAAPAMGIMIDGQALKFDQPPIVLNSRLLVPLRAIFEALGIQVVWNSKNGTIVAENKQTTIELQVGNPNATKNRNLVKLDIPPQIINGRTYVPTRFISEAFGCTVLWNKAMNTVNITTNDSQPVVPGTAPTEGQPPELPLPTLPVIQTPSSQIDTQTPVIRTDGVSITPDVVAAGEKVTVEFKATDDVGTQNMTVC